ncbi:MAG: NAD(P)-binding domain-containing protein [Thermodesulfobacteriota bacterium]
MGVSKAMGKGSVVGILIYIAPVAVAWILYILVRSKKERKNRAVRDEALNSGMTEPASLHPVINTNRCIGCGSCVNACPEQPGHHVLGIIGGKSHLINPTDCIGHGACFEVCPADAITLVFGTERRGVDIPMVKENFETNVPGIFIAGELGGMGLIRNAIEQGRQALEYIKAVEGVGSGDGSMHDLLIIGAGPAGFAASLGAMQHKLSCVTVEQDSLGGTVFHFPRGKIVMTAPAELPMVGMVKFTETTKEELLGFWEDVEKKTGVKINYKERVEEITKNGNGFTVKTSKDTYKARTVLLAIGRRGTPRKLGVPGEDQPKVVYRLIDPEQYRGQKVLVVGGGDSALEAATSIAAEKDTKVTISYRSEAFSRAKEKNRQKVKTAEADGRLTVLMKSNVKNINGGTVKIEQEGKLLDIENDAVIISAGGILPTAFLKKVGITVDTKYGTP